MHIRHCILGPSLSFTRAKSLLVNFTEAQALPEQTTSISLDVQGTIKNWKTDFIFDYNIFPLSIMHHKTQWKEENRKMIVGDIIIQRVVLPPIGLGLCMEFAVRICSLINEPKKLGFSYETLAGHAESGIAEFYFEEKEDAIYFTIRTFSQPSHWTARLVKHLFTLPYQAWCTQRALEHVRDQFIKENKNPQKY